MIEWCYWLKCFTSLLAWDNSCHILTPPLVSDVTSEQPLKKFHNDDVLLPRSGECFWLVVPQEKFALNNQKQYPDLGSERHQYGIVKCQLFCTDTSLHEGTLVMQVHVVYKQNPKCSNSSNLKNTFSARKTSISKIWSYKITKHLHSLN